MELDMTNPNSYSNLSHNITGASNYILDIYSHHEKDKVLSRLWIFDTNMHGCDGNPDGYGCIERD